MCGRTQRSEVAFYDAINLNNRTFFMTDYFPPDPFIEKCSRFYLSPRFQNIDNLVSANPEFKDADIGIIVKKSAEQYGKRGLVDQFQTRRGVYGCD